MSATAVRFTTVPALKAALHTPVPPRPQLSPPSPVTRPCTGTGGSAACTATNVGSTVFGPSIVTAHGDLVHDVPVHPVRAYPGPPPRPGSPPSPR